MGIDFKMEKGAFLVSFHVAVIKHSDKSNLKGKSLFGSQF